MTDRQKISHEAIQPILDEAVDNGSETVIQVSAWHKGNLILDTWAVLYGLRADGDSLLPGFSTGKGIASTAIHRLVEKGTLSWDTPICEYWPEFAAEGKETITLRHVLNHTAGMAMMPPDESKARATDWKAMCSYLAYTPPLRAPGLRRRYHAITFSWLVGETAHRADGRIFSRIVQEEVLDLLEIDTLFFGVPDDKLGLCINAEKPREEDDSLPKLPTKSNPTSRFDIPPRVTPLEDWINKKEVRQACIPGSNLYGNATGLARHYASLISKGVDGMHLLMEDTIKEATRWNPETDGNIPGDGKWGLGYQLKGPDENPGSVFGHGGYGGATGFADIENELAVAVVKNRMGGDITEKIVEAIYAIIR